MDFERQELDLLFFYFNFQVINNDTRGSILSFYNSKYEASLLSAEESCDEPLDLINIGFLLDRFCKKISYENYTNFIFRTFAIINQDINLFRALIISKFVGLVWPTIITPKNYRKQSKKDLINTLLKLEIDRMPRIWIYLYNLHPYDIGAIPCKYARDSIFIKQEVSKWDCELQKTKLAYNWAVCWNQMIPKC